MVRVRGRHGEGGAEALICSFTPQKCVRYGVTRGKSEGESVLNERLDCPCTHCPARILLKGGKGMHAWRHVGAKSGGGESGWPMVRGATAIAAWFAVATRKGAAHAFKALTGRARASRSAIRADAASGDRVDAVSVARAPKSNMRSPDA
eukprot:5669802-Pleurochrysis_carterae.AAC.2